jgi:hypothetical protein
VCDIHAVDAAAHYRQLLQLGREGFLASAAPAALVRYRNDVPGAEDSDEASAAAFDPNETLPYSLEGDNPNTLGISVFPLLKKPGASFPDRITIGRTSNNDVVIDDTSVSRLHAYVRRTSTEWIVADAGSKNGSWLRGDALEARKEHAIPSRSVLRLGEVDLTFYSAVDLYAALGGVP